MATAATPLRLATVALTASGRVQLLPTEVELKLLDKVDVEFPGGVGGVGGDLAAKFTDGVLCLTSHRLVWLARPGGPPCSCGLALQCVAEVCSPQKQQLFGSRTPRLRLLVRTDTLGAVTCGTSGSTALLSFAFRGVAPTELLQALHAALARRAWAAAPPVESAAPPKTATASGGGAPTGDAPERAVSAFSAAHAGVAGILRRQEEAQRVLGQSVSEAFTDLTALMDKARDMLAFVERMRAAEQRDNGTLSEELQSCFLSLGIASPVTRTTAGALFHQQLALQLADFLALHLDKSQGVMTLPDVYCLFNRARGTELVSPEDLLKACALWEQLGVRLRLRRFDSGVLAVQAQAHSDEKVAEQLEALAAQGDEGTCAADAAHQLGLTPAIAREYLLAAEARGMLCRDDAPDGLRFFVNPWRTPTTKC